MASEHETSGQGQLLAAGGVLPHDSDHTGEGVVPLTARTYQHPVLADRVVVRLVDGALGIAEDTAAGFLGLTPAEEPATVGLGLRQSLNFPEWVVVNHPDDGHHALAVVPELERIARLAKSTPRFAVDGYHALASRLAKAVPHFLPTFYEQAGRVLLSESETTYATQMFNRARKAETEYGLDVDPDRLDAVYVEFAVAGALPATALAGYAKELAARLPADVALDRFCELCIRGTAAGLTPSTQTANAMRRMVRAAAKAGDAAAAEEREWMYLLQLLKLPTTLDAPAGWWKVHLPALVALCREHPKVRGILLLLMPSDDWEGNTLPRWLDLLIATGATAGLVDAQLPAEQRPVDGSAGWLKRYLAARPSYRRDRLQSPAWYQLVEQMGDTLRAELAVSGATIDYGSDVDLLDLLLALDVPVTDQDRSLALAEWAAGEAPRDLVAITGQARHRHALRKALDRLSNNDSGRNAMQRLAASAGGREVLAEWVRDTAGRVRAAGLPGLDGVAGQLAWLPGEALALAADEVGAAVGTDLAEALAQSLRGGIFDELGWRAWEEAVAGVVDAKRLGDLVVVDAWPHLIVAGPAQARVIDADGTVLSHDLRIPVGDVWGETGFHYVDGELLVYWDSYEQSRTYHSASLRGYWHTSADAPQTLEGNRGRNQPRTGTITLPLAGGGRTTGSGVLHTGDSAVPEERSVISDGTSYWVFTRSGQERHSQWYEYDPATGECGQPGVPNFLAAALGTAPEGSELDASSSWLRPVPSAQPGPLGVPVDGLLGWRVVRLPDGAMRGEDLAGRTVTVAGATPVAAVTLPGDDQPRALLSDLRLVSPDGVVTASAHNGHRLGDFAAGSLQLPPVDYWHQLRPRDPEGSAALRRVDRETAAALLKGFAALQATDQETAVALPEGTSEAEAQAECVRAVLPQLGHDALVAGVAGVVRFAGARQASLDALGERLTAAITGELEEEVVGGPTDEQLGAALDGLTGASYWSWRSEPIRAGHQLHLIDKARRAPATTPAVRLHIDGPELPMAYVDWHDLLDNCAAVAVRGALATTPAEHQESLRQLLATFDRLGLATAEPAQWRRVKLHLDDSHLKAADGTQRRGHARHVMPLSGGAFLAVMDAHSGSSGVDATALHHDPSGAFTVPQPYTVTSSEPVGEKRPAGWLAAFLAEWAERGPVPWRPEAVDEFAQLTGASPTIAKLVLAGMPQVDTTEKLPAETRKTLGVKAADFTYARAKLAAVKLAVRQAVVAALLPAEPARLWTDGPDLAAAAAVWSAAVGRSPAIPEQLLIEATRSVRAGWGAGLALPALVDPGASKELSVDLTWTVRGDRVAPADEDANGFASPVLVGAVATAAWTAHHVPAGDPVRAALPAALDAVRARLANPDLMLSIDTYLDLETFRKVAGTPTETGEGFVRYGAVVLPTHDNMPFPGLRVALLDESGDDPYLPALRVGTNGLGEIEAALRATRDPQFAALLSDPGDPVAGERDADGTWWPQDPTRSVPDLVAEVAAAHGLSADAAAVYLTLLAMPDPTDRNVARWTGWKPARLKPARTELAGTDLVVQGTRSRAGRSLFLPGEWLARRTPQLPIEQWKASLFERDGQAGLGVTVPWEPIADLYRRTWQRLQDGDTPQYAELQLRDRNRR